MTTTTTVGVSDTAPFGADPDSAEPSAAQQKAGARALKDLMKPVSGAFSR